MDAETNPFEAGLGWVVKLSNDFIGRDALARIEAAGVKRKMVGLEVEGPLTVRNGYRIYRNGNDVGSVTSGPLSVELTGRNCGLGYVASADAAVGTELEIDIRGKRVKARVVAMPFCARRVKDEPGVNTWSPYELRFSEHHMWVRADENAGDSSKAIVSVGLSDFGQRSLGDILALELPKAGAKVAAGAAMAWGDSYRRAFELMAPVSGEVVEVNGDVAQDPSRLNAYPYVRNGLLKIRLEQPRAHDKLMSFADYAEHVGRAHRYDEWTRERRMT